MPDQVRQSSCRTATSAQPTRRRPRRPSTTRHRPFLHMPVSGRRRFPRDQGPDLLRIWPTGSDEYDGVIEAGPGVAAEYLAGRLEVVPAVQRDGAHDRPLAAGGPVALVGQLGT